MTTLTASPLRPRKPLRIATDIFTPVSHSSDSSSSSSSSTGQSITPSGITPSTGNSQYFFHAVCLYDFESSDLVHLPFHKDEVLTIVKQEPSGWWAAMRSQGDRIGWIPSSFMLPLDRSKVGEYPYESSNDVPVSAIHEWVPISEDYKVLSFHLVTPTDILCKGFDNRVRSHGPLFSPSYDNRSSDLRCFCVPPSPITPPPHRTQRLQFPQTPLPSTSGTLQAARDTSRTRPCGVDDRTSFVCWVTPDSSDAMTPELVYSAEIEESAVVLASGAADRRDSYCDGTQRKSQCFGLSASHRLAGHDQGVSDAKLRSLTSWGPDNLAEQFCVLMHTLYATIQQNNCLDWIRGQRSTEVTGLRHFLDAHDYIAAWVHSSVLACDNTSQQVEALDFWIRVAEKCRVLRNFDSLCAIIVALSRSSPSSLGPALARCKHEQTFATLRNTLDAANQFRRFMDTMDAAKGPSVPFVRVYLDHIKGLANELLRQSGFAANVGSSAARCKIQLAAVATLLRHQPLVYDFKVKKSIRRFIDGELQRLGVGKESEHSAPHG